MQLYYEENNTIVCTVKLIIQVDPSTMNTAEKLKSII